MTHPTAQCQLQKRSGRSQFADFWQNPSPVALTEAAKVQHMITNDFEQAPLAYMDYAFSRGSKLSRKGDHGLSLMTVNALILWLRIPTNITGLIRNYRQHFALTNPDQSFIQRSNTALIKAVTEKAFINPDAKRRFRDFKKTGLRRLNEVGYTATSRTTFRRDIEDLYKASPSDPQNEAFKKAKIARRKEARQKLFARAQAQNSEMKEKEARQLRGRLYKTLRVTDQKNMDFAITDAMHQTLSNQSRRKTWSFLPSLKP